LIKVAQQLLTSNAVRGPFRGQAGLNPAARLTKEKKRKEKEKKKEKKINKAEERKRKGIRETRRIRRRKGSPPA